MRFGVDQLRRVFRLPVLIFLALLLGSVLASFSVVYVTLMPNLKGEYIVLDNPHVRLDYPKNWYGVVYEEENATVGNVYGGMFAAPFSFAIIIINVYDERATQSYLGANDFQDIQSIILFEANRVYNWSLANCNENATIQNIENGTVSVSGHMADYMTFFIHEGYLEEDIFYNVTYTLLAYMDSQRLVQVAFWGEQADCEQNGIFFDSLLNSLLVKTV